MGYLEAIGTKRDVVLKSPFGIVESEDPTHRNEGSPVLVLNALRHQRSIGIFGCQKSGSTTANYAAGSIFGKVETTGADVFDGLRFPTT
jgi:hypothetical protein